MKRANEEIYNILSTLHSDAQCELNFTTPFELLVAVILSAQCTDKRVNIVTEQLFKIASTPKDFVDMPITELEEHIKPCGFYHNKAKALKEMATSVLALGRVENFFQIQRSRLTFHRRVSCYNNLFNIIILVKN